MADNRPVQPADLIGKTILITMSFKSPDGELLEERQSFGRVFDAGPQGVLLFLEPSGQEFALPPHTRNITAASPGEYTLKPDGQTVRDPDYLATWNVTRRE